MARAVHLAYRTGALSYSRPSSAKCPVTARPVEAATAKYDRPARAGVHRARSNSFPRWRAGLPAPSTKGVNACVLRKSPAVAVAAPVTPGAGRLGDRGSANPASVVVFRVLHLDTAGQVIGMSAATIECIELQHRHPLALSI